MRTVIIFIAILLFKGVQGQQTGSQSRNESSIHDEIITLFNDEKTLAGYNISYDELLDQMKTLKVSLYKNVTQIDDNDLAPPRGSEMEFDEWSKMMKIVTQVGIHIHPDRIVKMDVEEQALTLLVQELMWWTDQNLEWYQNDELRTSAIKLVELNASNIWTPPLVASHVVETVEVVNTGLVLVYNDGQCFYQRTMQYKLPCAVNVRNFPFDTHTCTFQYDQPETLHYRIVLKLLAEFNETVRAEKHLFSQQYAHLEWQGIISNESITGDDSSILKFSITLQRQSHFYAIVLIFPTVLLNMLSLVVFTLPIDNTERENFSLTLTLTYFVLVMIIVDTSPPTGNQIPKLGFYVVMCTVIVVLTFGMSLFLIELHEHKRAKQQKMSRRLFSFLQKFCCFDHSYKDYKKSLGKRYGPNKSAKDVDKLLDKKDDSLIDEQKEEFKWKLFANALNYVFFAMTLIAHILLPCLVYLV